jgi:hypothetical protein
VFLITTPAFTTCSQDLNEMLHERSRFRFIGSFAPQRSFPKGGLLK